MPADSVTVPEETEALQDDGQAAMSRPWPGPLWLEHWERMKRAPAFPQLLSQNREAFL